MVGSFLLSAAGLVVLPVLQTVVFGADSLPNELDSPSGPDLDTYTPAGEMNIEHELTVVGFARIPSAKRWRSLAHLAVERGKHGPYKFVMVKGAGLFVGPSHRELSGGEKEENLHTGIAQGASADVVLAAGYFMVGPSGEFVVTPIPSTRYPRSQTGERFRDGLEAYFGGEVEIVPLAEVSPSVREEFERGLMAAAQFKPRKNQ